MQVLSEEMVRYGSRARTLQCEDRATERSLRGCRIPGVPMVREKSLGTKASGASRISPREKRESPGEQILPTVRAALSAVRAYGSLQHPRSYLISRRPPSAPARGGGAPASTGEPGRVRSVDRP